MKIPRYQSQIEPSRASIVPRADVGVGGIVGEGIERFARFAGSQVLEAQERYIQRQRQDYLLDATVSFRNAWRDVTLQELGKTGKDTYGNVERIKSWVEQNKGQWLDGAPDEETRKRMELHIADASNAMLDDLSRLQVHERKRVTLSQLEALAEANARDAYISPDKAGTFSDDLGMSVQEAKATGSIDDVDAEAIARKQRSVIYGSALDGIIDRAPNMARKKLQEFSGSLTASQLSHFSDKIDAKEQQIASEAERMQHKAEVEANRMARSLWSRSDDAIASIVETGKEGPVDIEGKLRAIGTEESTQLAEEYRTKKKIALSTYSVVNRFSDLPIADQIKRVDEEFTFQPGKQGAHEYVQSRDMALRVVRDRQKRFIDDPAAYTIPLLKASGPMTEEQKADQILALQAEIGKGINYTPSVFPKEEIKSMSERYKTMDATGKLEMIRGIQEYGKHSNRILNEIGAGTVAQLASEMDRATPKNSIFSRTLVEAASLKESDIPGDPKTKTKLKKDLLSELESNDVWKGLTKTLAYQPQNSKLRAHVAGMQTALQNMAMMEGDASKVVSFFDNTYSSIADDSIGYLTYPKSSALTENQIKVQLEKFRQGAGNAIEWQKPALGDSLFSEKVRDVSTNGVWVNASDGNGYVLLEPSSGLPIVRQDGKPYRITLDDILRAHDSDVAKAKIMKESSDPSGMGGFDMSQLEPGFKGALSFVLKEEGGYSNDPSDMGGETKYGISKRAHPDVDIAGLTKEQAASIYEREYWRGSGADRITDPKLALAHFDTAVNMGVETAKEMLDASGGDLGKYLELRKSRYAQIIERDPGQRKFERGWMNRMDRLRGLIG